MLRASALSSLRPLSGVHALAESRPLLTASNCSERSEAYVDSGSGWVDRGEKARLRPSPIPCYKSCLSYDAEVDSCLILARSS
jgi:hypothetical protein